MINKKHYEVIIVGGSYAGLSAAMALGRSLRNVLIIDSGRPCNAQTPHSHNFITQDGIAPKLIAENAMKQVLAYKTVTFLSDIVTTADKEKEHFKVQTKNNKTFACKKILFTTGVKDVMPQIQGFPQCWGISVLHCPYCHGYEVRNEKTGILANGETAFDLCKLIQHWTDDLTLFTNGKPDLSVEQKAVIEKLNIKVIEKEISELEHSNGVLDRIAFTDGSKFPLKAIFSRTAFEQHCNVPFALGCALSDEGYIDVDFFQKTSVDGIFAAGDNTTRMRTVSLAVAAGTKAGASINMELINEKLPY